jgi:hypothetical protein
MGKRSCTRPQTCGRHVGHAPRPAHLRATPAKHRSRSLTRRLRIKRRRQASGRRSRAARWWYRCDPDDALQRIRLARRCDPDDALQRIRLARRHRSGTIKVRSSVRTRTAVARPPSNASQTVRKTSSPLLGTGRPPGCTVALIDRTAAIGELPEVRLRSPLGTSTRS